MEKKFVVGRDGFIEYERPYTLEKAARVYNDTIKNKYLYEYDVSVYELNEDNTIKRRVDFQELQALTS